LNLAVSLLRKIAVAAVFLPLLTTACGGGDGDSDALQECLAQVQDAQNQCLANNGKTSQGAVACTAVAVAADANCESQHGSN
jgi:hypothetical protein